MASVGTLVDRVIRAARAGEWDAVRTWSEAWDTTPATHPDHGALALSRALQHLFDGRWDDAFRVARSAVAWAEGRDGEVLRRGLALAGSARVWQGRREEARPPLGRALELMEAAGDPNGVAEVCRLMAIASPSEASIWHDRALAQPGLGPRTRVGLLLAAAHQREATGRLEAALDVLHEARRASGHDRTVALLHSGRVHLLKGNLWRAEVLLSAAAARTTGRPSFQGQVTYAQAMLARAQGDFVHADACLTQAIGHLRGGNRALAGGMRALVHAEQGVAEGWTQARGWFLEARRALGEELAGAVEAHLLACEADHGDLRAFDRRLETVSEQCRSGGIHPRAADGLALAGARLAQRSGGGWASRRSPTWALAHRVASACGRPGHQALAATALRALRAGGHPVPLGPFAIDAPIGRGGMATVFGAVHGPSQQRVAVKVLSGWAAAIDRQALTHEIRAVARLDHPVVVRVLHHGIVDATAAAMEPDLPPGSPWLALEHCAGGSLTAACGGIGYAHARGVLGALLDGLAHAHARGVLHLDLKPDNVLLTENGDLKIVDFGLAFAAAGALGNTAVGTPSTMAPEQIRARWAAVGPWTDLYAVGCLAWMLMEGRPPFEGDPADVVRAHLSRPPDLQPVRAPPAFVAWVRALLDKDPSRRPQTAAAARRALDALPIDDRDAPAVARPSTHEPTFDLESVDLEDGRAPAARSAGWRAPVLADPPPDPPSPPPGLAEASVGLIGLRVPRLVGRELERGRLWDALCWVADAERGARLTLSGPPRIGVGALIRDLAERAATCGVRVVHDAGEAIRAAHLGPVVWIGAGPSPPDDLPILQVLDAGDGPADLDVSPLPDEALLAVADALLPLHPVLRGEVVRRAAGRPGVLVDAVRALVEEDRIVRRGGRYTLRRGTSWTAAAPLDPGLRRGAAADDVDGLLADVQVAWRRDDLVATERALDRLDHVQSIQLLGEDDRRGALGREVRVALALASGALHEAVEMAGQLAARCRTHGWPEVEARALCHGSEALRSLGRGAEARALQERVLAMAHRLPTRDIEVETHLRRHYDRVQGMPQVGAAPSLEAARAALEGPLSDPALAHIQVCRHEARRRVVRGDLEGAAAAMGEAQTWARRGVSPSVLVGLLMDRGSLDEARGALADAETAYREARDLAAVTVPRRRDICELNLAMIDLRRGDLARARERVYTVLAGRPANPYLALVVLLATVSPSEPAFETVVEELMALPAEHRLRDRDLLACLEQAHAAAGAAGSPARIPLAALVAEQRSDPGTEGAAP